MYIYIGMCPYFYNVYYTYIYIYISIYLYMCDGQDGPMDHHGGCYVFPKRLSPL